MKEEKLAILHRKMAYRAVDYDIALVGDEGLVAFDDFRLMDIEHIIHELAHCTLWGLDISLPECLEGLKRIEKAKPEYQLQLNEIEAFSVTMEVMRRFGAKIIVEDFTASLEIAAYGFEPPINMGRQAWLEGFLQAFVKSPRGEAAVYRLMDLFENEWNVSKETT